MFRKSLLLLVFFLAACAAVEPNPGVQPVPTAAPTDVPGFSGEEALRLVTEQVALGPRIPGTPGHAEFLEWAQGELVSSGWDVSLQETEYSGYPITNVIARRGGGGAGGFVILGAHYDTRRYADQDPDPENRTLPVPGANDGASGVAVLLELARTLPENDEQEIWLVLFDQEDGGDIGGQPWILGSTAFVRDLPELSPGRLPDSVVVVDMVGDADLNIHVERNSDPALVEEIWQAADALGNGDVIIPTLKYSMIDDHRPFLQAGIPAVVLIDFDTPFWHTRGDIPENVSAGSLQAVGETLRYWLTGAVP